MRIVRHNAHISERKRRARIFSFFGFLLLAGSLLIAWYPEFLLFAYVAMLGGFILFNMGMQQLGKWTRNPRNDQFLDHQMKSLSDKVTLIHYPQFGKHIIEHVVVHPGGLLVLTAREVDGTIEKRGTRWRRKGGLYRRLFSFSGPQVGNPSFETDANVKRAEDFLAEHQMEVDVEGAIVFVHPRAELDIEDPDYPVLHGDEVAEFIRDLPADETFTREERERIVELLSIGELVETPQAQKQGARRPRPVRRVAAPRAKPQ
jgi:hypothetical protein